MKKEGKILFFFFGKIVILKNFVSFFMERYKKFVIYKQSFLFGRKIRTDATKNSNFFLHQSLKIECKVKYYFEHFVF